MELPEYIRLIPPVWTALIVFMVLWLSFDVVLFILLYRRRHHPYLKARSVTLVMFSVVGSGLSLVSPSLIVLLGRRYPCWATHIGVSASGVLALGPDVIRCIRLIFLDRAGKLKAVIAERFNDRDSLPHDDDPSRVQERKRQRLLTRVQWLTRLSRDRWLAGIYGTLVTVNIIIYVLFIGIFPSERSLTECERSASITIFHTCIIIFGYGAALIILSIAIYKIREEFNIKREIWINAGLAAGCVVGRLAWLLAVPETANTYFPQTLFYHMAIVPAVINMALLPLIKSYSRNYQTLEFMKESSIGGEPLKELRHVLHTDKLSTMFLEYCRREFSAENFYFIKQLDRLSQQNISDAERTLYNEDMINEYIYDNSPLCLNISSDARSTLLHQWTRSKGSMNPIDPLTLFQDVQDEVYRNLLDTFLRFRVSAPWQEHRKRLAAERDAYRDLLVETDGNAQEVEMNTSNTTTTTTSDPPPSEEKN
eukprot:gb/GECH01008618.1/.p1 GENE.gb/GECH01008618.1/~~gb/GECH01008618.1/.p1  ORF type:complete len:480 (+),score=74.39 gb/GECH01008618.1/:1-1440(+)